MNGRALLLLSLAFLTGCRAVENRQIDQTKFEVLLSAAKEVEADLDANAGLRRELLRKLKSEASMAESRATTDAERNMTRLYGDAASMLQFSESIRESEQATGKMPASDDPKSSARFRRIGIEKLNQAKQVLLGKQP